MSVPNFRKSYHTVLGPAIDFNGTRIIINIAAGSNGGFLQRLRTREKCIFCTICHCIEKSMLQTYQWDIQFEMQYCQDPQGPWLQAKEGAGPWSGHNVMQWCVCVLPRVWCVCMCMSVYGMSAFCGVCVWVCVLLHTPLLGYSCLCFFVGVCVCVLWWVWSRVD